MDGESLTGANSDSTEIKVDTLTPPVNDGFDKVNTAADNVSDIDVNIAADKEEKNEEGVEQKISEIDNTFDRFDKHPRFQELNKRIHDLQLELTATKSKLEVLTPKQQAEILAKAKTDDSKPLPFKDITKMSKQELLEWHEDNPIEYEANKFQQFLYEARQILKTEKDEEQKDSAIKSTYEKYESSNPDFRQKWDSGEIQKYMEANPGHNAISAHMTIIQQEKIDKIVAEAVKEAEERVKKNFQVKRKAEVLGSGSSVKINSIPDEIKNSKKYGGSTAVLAQRLAQRRQAMAGE